MKPVRRDYEKFMRGLTVGVEKPPATSECSAPTVVATEGAQNRIDTRDSSGSSAPSLVGRSRIPAIPDLLVVVPGLVVG